MSESRVLGLKLGEFCSSHFDLSGQQGPGGVHRSQVRHKLGVDGGPVLESAEALGGLLYTADAADELRGAGLGARPLTTRKTPTN